jgi:phage-related minor tail protein
MPFLVGERGPELFMPSGDGSIVSNLALGQMANNRGSSTPSVSANFNVTINLTGGAGSTAQLANELEPAVIAILDKAWNMATASSVSRGALA